MATVAPHILFGLLGVSAALTAGAWLMAEPARAPRVAASAASPLKGAEQGVAWTPADFDVDLWYTAPPPPPAPPVVEPPSPPAVPAYELLGIWRDGAGADGVDQPQLKAEISNPVSGDLWVVRQGESIGIETVIEITANSLVLTRAHNGRRVLELDQDVAPRR